MRSESTLRAGLRRGGVAALAVLLLSATRSPYPTVELIAPARVHAGDTVDIVLRVRNDGPAPLTLELSGRPVGFDVIVTNPDGKEVWRRLAGGAVGAALMLLTLQPGESRDFTARWPLVDLNGNAVTPGRYTLRGILPMTGRRLATPERDLVVDP